MNNFFVLIAGDLKRLRRYGIFWASLAVSLLWIIFIQIVDLKNLSQFFGLFVMADATLMSFLLVGVSII